MCVHGGKHSRQKQHEGCSVRLHEWSVAMLVLHPCGVSTTMGMAVSVADAMCIHTGGESRNGSPQWLQTMPVLWTAVRLLHLSPSQLLHPIGASSEMTIQPWTS